jgi:hypothetical protein
VNLASSNLIGLAVFTTMLAIGQLLFKKAGLFIRGLPLRDGLIALAQVPAFYTAIVLYALSTFLWVWLLSRVTLMQAYPWGRRGHRAAAQRPNFRRAGRHYWLGASLIVAGIVLTQYSIRPQRSGNPRRAAALAAHGGAQRPLEVVQPIRLGE